jgi:hypothetical protein
MLVDIELLVLPYSSAAGRSVLSVLIEQFNDGDWCTFKGAVAFAKTTGNFPDLIDAITGFLDRDGVVSLTFGADIFAGNARGSDYDAILELLEAFRGRERAEVFIYQEPGRTFHPKIYLFESALRQEALLIVGSSNWSEGGLAQNVEANVLMRFDLSEPAHKAAIDDLNAKFNAFWRQT